MAASSVMTVPLKRKREEMEVVAMATNGGRRARAGEQGIGVGGEGRGGGGGGGGEGALEAGGGGDVDLALLEALAKGEEGVDAGGQAVDVIDVKALKRLVLSFEKKLKENLEARMKYVDAPEKFLDSEVDLDQEVKKLHALAAVPELYPELVRLNSVSSILGLLSHENTDLAIDVVNLLHDLTDSDALEDNEEPALVLVNALVDNNALELLVQNLSRLDERDPDEAAAVFNTLGIVENLVEVNPQVTESVCERTKLLRWLLNRVKVRDFDSNRLYASEILAILLQNSSVNQRRVGNINGVDTLLQAVFQYKGRDPRSTEEQEMVENLFDALCSVVLPQENKERFVKAEGVQLMILIMKNRKFAYFSAIKALDFALTRCTSACEVFVDVLGLKTLFAAFMGKVPSKYKKRKGENIENETDERVISLICSLLLGVSRGSRRDRLLTKFVEKEYEKIDRLMELYVRFTGKVEAEEKRQQRSAEGGGRRGGGGGGEEEWELDSEERYLTKLDAGLYTLELLALILANIWAVDHRGMRERIMMLLHQYGMNREHIKKVLQEYVDNIGDADGEEERDKRKVRVLKLINHM
ncbi:hypothetical protein CBR_g66787 [Chara braunii]|uniref:Beta-catenin-like protein 1 N-terminal domain-containing protein n=1 Tax=Chara braunii TaxID=69332 RepID=A0A388K9F0_CHABU|nr:hypothetical protein CBR_g66787 [Chara braunii]|eukprot:GBG66651.1 hypothetical protein CBR_g66787 [Chara braunii]